MRLLLVSIGAILSLVFSGTSVQAQTSLPPSTSPAFIDLQTNYLTLLSQYREKEDSFAVTRAQYYQLNTLASQELVLKEARELMVLRADILQTYLRMLSILFDETNGIPLEQKFAIATSVNGHIDSLALHRNDVLQAPNRAALDAESEKFVALYEDISEHSYLALSYIKLGRVQTTYDKLRIIRDKVKDDVYSGTLTTNQLAQKDRGFAEINHLIDNISSKINLVESRVRDGATSHLSGYTRLTQQLSPLFTQMNQTIQFLKEIR